MAVGHPSKSLDGTALDGCRRVVVKIGSALIVGSDQRLRQNWLASITADLAHLMAHGVEVIVVSSGAIALGCAAQGLPGRPGRLDQAQAAACIGQISLMQAFRHALAPHDLMPGQMLLTLADLDGRRSYLNARAALETLVEQRCVPIINENDATATQEIRVGDNDRLAARVAQMMDADMLLLLSDIDGLYTADPHSAPNASHLPEIDEITPEILALAAPLSSSAMSRGGMPSKLEAAHIATQSGCAMLIMDGRADAPITRLLAGERHTRFAPSPASAHNARHKWLAGQLGDLGTIVVDYGAIAAIRQGNSLLAAGIVETKNAFGRGDAVHLCGPDGAALATGLTNYDSTEIDKIKGLKSDDIAGRLGYTRSATVVHRDNMAIGKPWPERMTRHDERSD